MPEQIIKLWKDEGFEIKSCSKEKFEVYKQWVEDHHYIHTKILIEKDFFYIVGHFPNKYKWLLIKTLTALDKEV